MVTGKKYDTGKPDLTALLGAHESILVALAEVSEVVHYGRLKYGNDDNWRLVSPVLDRYCAAAIRHASARLRGDITDPESGCCHMAHAIVSLLFVLALDMETLNGGNNE